MLIRPFSLQDIPEVKKFTDQQIGEGYYSESELIDCQKKSTTADGEITSFVCAWLIRLETGPTEKATNYDRIYGLSPLKKLATFKVCLSLNPPADRVTAPDFPKNPSIYLKNWERWVLLLIAGRNPRIIPRFDI